jgi:hypothetical protein
MADDQGFEIVAATAEGATRGLAQPVVDAARAMAGAVFGDTVEALDEAWALRIRQRAAERAELRRIVFYARAKEMCDAAGITPGEIGLKLLRPIDEGATLEEDETMIDRWAALLANASAGPSVAVAFPRILADLTAGEAAILDKVRGDEQRGSWDLGVLQVELYPDSVSGPPDRGQQLHRVPGYELHLTNLERLGLCSVTRRDRGQHELARALRDELSGERRSRVRLAGVLAHGNTIELTAWGLAFLEACEPPTRADPGAAERE